jgi:formylglycine-generating enzyme
MTRHDRIEEYSPKPTTQANEIMSYETATLRRFIQEYFSSDELDTLLFDYFPTVREEFTPGMVKSQYVKLLLEFCYRHGKMPDLLAALQRERPTTFDPDDFVKNQPALVAFSTPALHLPAERNPRQIFLSHAHQDAQVAQKLAHDLEAHGYDIWLAPDSIRPGEKWVEAINRGLEESGLFVLLLSPEAVASRWVNMETNAAIEFVHEGEMQLFPLLLKACRPPPLWRSFHHISLRGGYEQALAALLNALEPPTHKLPADPAAKAPATVGQPTATQSQLATTPDNYVDAKTGKEMVRVPAGEFLYRDDKKKLHLDEFWIAKTPVTNMEYARFVADAEHESPQHWKGKTPPADIADHPVIYVSWHDAKAYAAWAGMELPTEQQWEKAARGTDGRKYPWGDEWRENYGNTGESGIGKTTPVGQFSPQGDSPYGCVDMAGNVWEWTDSLDNGGEDWRVLRGGPWNNDRDDARAAYRNFIPLPDYRSYAAGFRVVVVRRPQSHLDY